MKERFVQWMRGRYGFDELGRFLNILTIILLLLGIITYTFISYIALIFILITYFRAFSKNINARAAENAIYLRYYKRLKGWLKNRKMRFTQRKTHCFFVCDSCKKTVRVPRGKGEITITCPACHHQFVKRT